MSKQWKQITKYRNATIYNATNSKGELFELA